MEKSYLKSIFNKHDLDCFGCFDFKLIEGDLLQCGVLKKLQAITPKSVIVTVFPYKFNDTHTNSNIARFARVEDYHIVAGKILKDISVSLSKTYKENTFLPFIDNSLIPEVKSAYFAGLGFVGKHGLLITEKYGSWVFIGTIITDKEVDSDTNIKKTYIHELCKKCSICEKACPSQCIGTDSLNSKDLCVSALTQKKGELSSEEIKIIQKGKYTWGCDICQESCPLNKGVVTLPHPSFLNGYNPLLTKELALKSNNKAYSWRGTQTLLRNLELMK